MKKIVTIHSGLGVPSTSELLVKKISNFVNTRATAKGEGLEFTNINLKELSKDLLTYLDTGGINTPRLQKIKEELVAADGLIAVSPIFSGSYNGLFKLFFDTLDPDSLNGIPVIIGATAGTPRHSLALEYSMRPLFIYFRAQVVPTGIFAATDDFGSENKEIAANLQARVKRAASEFVNLIFIEKAVIGGFTETEDDPADTNVRLKRKSGTSITEEKIPDFKNLLEDYL